MKNTYLIAAVFIGCSSTVIMHGMYHPELYVPGETRFPRGCPVQAPYPMSTNGLSWCQLIHAAATTAALKKTQ